MRRTTDLRKRLQQAEIATKPKRPAIYASVVIDGMEVSRAPVAGARYLVIPPIMGLDEWEALAAPAQDKMVADAMSDISLTIAENTPDGDGWDVTHKYKRPRSH